MEENNEIRVDEMNTSTSVTQAEKPQSSTRKRNRSTDSLATSMAEMKSMVEMCITSMDKNMGEVANKIGQHVTKLSDDRRRIFDEVQKMTTLSPRDRIVVARKIGEHADYVDIYLTANDETKEEFVAMLLEEGL